MLDTFDFTLRYQRTPCVKYHVRPLTLLQQEIMYRCDGRVTVADLADATKYTHPEVRAVLSFLSAHGLVKTLAPEPWLFDPLPHNKPWRPPVRSRSRLRRFLVSLLPGGRFHRRADRRSDDTMSPGPVPVQLL